MKLIQEWRSFWRMYSVWCFVALIVVSVLDALLSLYEPKDPLHALLSALLSAVLAIAGIFLRVVKQDVKTNAKEQPK